MRIREVIARLQELAEQLPDGLDSGVRIHICNGDTAAGITTSAIGVDSITELGRDLTQVTSAYAAIIGHPHLAVSTTRPVTSQLDEVVQQWTGAHPSDTGQTETSQASGGLQVVGTPDPETLTIQQPGGAGIRMELTAEGQLRYPPGHPDAVRAGCLCDPEKNNHGRGAQSEGRDQGGAFFITRRFCPLHVSVDPSSGT